MKRLLLLVLIFVVSVASNAQIKFDVFELYKKDAELTIGFNNRRTHLHNEFGTIYGFKVGLNFDRRLKNTFVISSTIIDLGKPKSMGATHKTAQLHFASIAEEFTFYTKQNLSFSTYFTLGYGVNFQKTYTAAQDLLVAEQRPILPIEFGLQTSYIVFTWLDIKAGAGWRHLLVGNYSGLSGYFFKLSAGIKYKAFRKALNI
ncbi:MAG: hypothetical protein ACPGLV_03795 [Bacteroidia bacterium]